VNSLPNGMHTRIGDNGAFLSGGQRQRVGLARAIVGDPKLVVLDEPNSSLDEAGEQALNTTLQALKERQCTTIVISHRTSILPAIDHILILRDGIARLYGTRDEVLSRLEAPRSITPEQNHLDNDTEGQVKKIVQRQTANNNKHVANPVLAGAA
jgi:ABC-type protease/lipase transport system fused ATPase/permease subunit